MCAFLELLVYLDFFSVRIKRNPYECSDVCSEIFMILSVVSATVSVLHHFLLQRVSSSNFSQL